MTNNGWSSVLEAAAIGAAGEDSGCCQVYNADGSCCMTENARYIFKLIDAAGGPSLEQCEALARGDLILSKPI